MNAKKEIEAFAPRTVNKLSAKNDPVITTYASLEFQYRETDKKLILNYEQQIKALEIEVKEIKKSIDFYQKQSNKQIIFSKMLLLKQKEIELDELKINKKLLENNLMHTPETIEIKDHEAHEGKNTHSADIGHLAKGGLTALDRQGIFLESRCLRDNSSTLAKKMKIISEMKTKYPGFFSQETEQESVDVSVGGEQGKLDYSK